MNCALVVNTKEPRTHNLEPTVQIASFVSERPPTFRKSWNNGDMSKTRAMRALEKAGAEFEIHEYRVEAAEGSYGEAVAAAVGVPSDRVFKTLIATVDGAPVVGIVPVDRQLSLKALARAAAGKRARITEAKDAERLTGYVVGGISPFGRIKRLPVFVDKSAFGHDTVYVSGGQRGIQLEMKPDLLIDLIAGKSAPISG